MKMLLTFAAIAAALASASAASAQDTVGSHWEWRSQPSYGPESNVPSRTRIWVKDAGSTMANSDCAMTKADASDCMMYMPGKAERPSAG